MQQQPISRKRAVLILAALLAVLGIIIWLVSLGLHNDTNQFGKFIKIQNYSSKVKNLNSNARDAMESYLYNVVVKNKIAEKDASRVSDATIREGSDSQKYNSQTTVYDGSFIVDMQSIKQSYNVQYSFSRDKTQYDLGGNQVVVSCLPEKDLKWGPFDCTDLVSEQSAQYSEVLAYLPYENTSFKLSPDATRGDFLTIVVTLHIADIDLSGDQSQDAAAVAMYKGEVKKWFDARNLDMSKYTFDWNYNDQGQLIRNDTNAGD